METEIWIKVALGGSRYETQWSTLTMPWSEMVRRCSTPKRTGETLSEYSAMSRDAQGAIKDVGGFVGGALAGKRRVKGSVSSRSCATLDLDFCDFIPADEIWESFTGAYHCAALMYSTHKHTSECPRLRLVVPFSHEITPDRYDAVARRIAAAVGIDRLDPTTYQPHRLFYWPSCAADGEFYFRAQDGAALDPDAVLATYDDWHDASAWPRSTLHEEAQQPRLTGLTESEDPRTKPGVIGAFCRAYSIEAAIDTFLSDIYRKQSAGRYTYAYGSSTGGLVCYEGLFAYSNHGTDPARGHNHNAFDLVRVHLYGDQDAGTRTDNPTRLPSFEAMSRMALADERVRSIMAADSRTQIADDFGDIPGEEPAGVPAAEPEPADDRKKRKASRLAPRGVTDEVAEVRAALPEEVDVRLERGRGGIVRATTPNVELILSRHAAFAGHIYYDTMAGRIRIDGTLPWERPVTTHDWTNNDDSQLRSWLQRYYDIKGRDLIADALANTAGSNARNPLREYFEALHWDGRERLDRVIIEYIGAVDSPLNRTMTRIQFAAAVRRVYEPGCKHDYCLIIQGPQGCGKSTFLAIMGGEYYREGVSFGSKDGYEEVRGCSIVELGELKDLKRVELEDVKSFITATEDRYRAAYAARAERVLRTCVFFGTSNNDDFLKDSTGARRFPVIVAVPFMRTHGDLWFDELRANRDQLWAEAVVRYKQGTPSYLPGDLQGEMQTLQEKFTDDDGQREIDGLAEAFANTLLPPGWADMSLRDRRLYYHHGPDEIYPARVPRTRASVIEFLSEYMQMQPGTPTYRAYAKKARRAFLALGWELLPTPSAHTKKLYGVQRAFARPDTTL